MNIRKALTAVTLAAVFVCSNIHAMADYCEEYASDDYREQPIYNTYNANAVKPIANFKVKRLRDGVLMDEIISDSGYDLGTPFPTMDCYVGDTIVFDDLSNPKDGNSIKTWDFQYYGTLGDSYKEYSYNILESASFELTEPGETAFFLCVKSDLPVKTGSLDAWSDNGNHQTIGRNKWFPKGMYWYFASARIIINPAPEAKVNVRYWNVPMNKVFYKEQLDLGELTGDNTVKTTVHVDDKDGYEFSGWNVQLQTGEIQYTGDERDVDIELAPWNPVKNLNIECIPYFTPECRVRFWDMSAGRIMSESSIFADTILHGNVANVSYEPEEVGGYDYGGWSIQLPDSSIEQTGDAKPVTVALSGEHPLKYLNIKYYPKDGGSSSGGDTIITVTPLDGVCDGEIEWTETDSHKVRNGTYSDGTPRYKTCNHTFTYKAVLSAEAELTPSTFKSGYGFETKVTYKVTKSLVKNDGGCSSWGNSRSAKSTVSDPTKATVYVPWTMTNRLGTQPQAISMEKSGKTFVLPVSPVSEAGARKIYTDVALAGTEEEPVQHSVDIYISGGGVGDIEFCKKLTPAFVINGDMYSDDFSGMN